jgi:hypothetical protein
MYAHVCYMHFLFFPSYMHMCVQCLCLHDTYIYESCEYPVDLICSGMNKIHMHVVLKFFIIFSSVASSVASLHNTSIPTHNYGNNDSVMTQDRRVHQKAHTGSTRLREAKSHVVDGLHARVPFHNELNRRSLKSVNTDNRKYISEPNAANSHKISSVLRPQKSSTIRFDPTDILGYMMKSHRKRRPTSMNQQILKNIFGNDPLLFVPDNDQVINLKIVDEEIIIQTQDFDESLYERSKVDDIDTTSYHENVEDMNKTEIDVVADEWISDTQIPSRQNPQDATASHEGGVVENGIFPDFNDIFVPIVGNF